MTTFTTRVKKHVTTELLKEWAAQGATLQTKNWITLISTTNAKLFREITKENNSEPKSQS